jgi:beta-galactosidase/beta-glucuronidase
MENPVSEFNLDAHTTRVTGYLNPLPRSVVRRNEYQLLDGEWRFELDLEDVGLRERWYLSHQYKGTVIWPTTIEKLMSEAQDLQMHTEPDHDNVVAWYEREFDIPDGWQHDPNALVQVTFGACGYETRVWLNGHPLKTVEGQETHFGEWTSFSFELPPELLEPRNRITVRTADSLDAEIPRGKQESRVYKRGGIWYQTISGPVRSVWIEPVSRNRLRSRLAAISTIEDRLVEFVLTTRIHDEGDYTIILAVSPVGSDRVIATEHAELHLRPGNKAHRITMELPNASLWSPDSPNLYHLTAQLNRPGGRISRIETHFGLRKIEARGRHIYLNNEQIYLDGILYQPGTATFEQIKSHMFAMKRLGCNLVRVHIAGVDPRIYDLADEIGLLLWVEVPSPHSSSQRSRDNHWAELMRLLVIAGSHPSVIICGMYNEDWGVQDIEANALTREYIARLFAFMRHHYPQILMVDNDGWRHVSTDGRLESHLLTAHFYTPDLDRWREMLDKLVEGQLEDVAAAPLVVGDPYFYRGQVPLLVSEWGGFGFVNYGGPQNAAEQTAHILAFKEELRRRPIAGDIYTQATSIEEEVNGLIDFETGELRVPEGTLGPRPNVVAH